VSAARPAGGAAAAGVRAFVALELDARVHAALAELQQRLRPTLGACRFVRPEGIHLTLRFLGPSRPAQLEALTPLLAAAASACPAFVAPVRGLGTFPDRGSPRVLWLGMELKEAALELQRACERAARQARFEREERPFRAHLTLGRWRERVPRPTLPEADLGTTRVESLVLFESELHPDGARYTPLARLRLGG
jgi:2'-5' RNA ligase